jgi:seryl-tRNA synthetase
LLGLLDDPCALGVYGRDLRFETLLSGLSHAISALTWAGECEVVRFPPVISRDVVERCGYLHTFPHLLGTVHSFTGNDAAHAQLLEAVEAGENWGARQSLSDVVLTPAACYAVYPRVAGALAPGGRTLDVESWCFRQEPSHSPERMRSFRMREFVRLGEVDAVREWRDRGLDESASFLRGLGLEPTIAPANDPFFGATARFMAASQRDQQLKFELLVDVGSARPAAVMSCNYHRDHFGEAFGIRTADVEVAHTACIGFGLERIALALLAAGLDDQFTR